MAIKMIVNCSGSGRCSLRFDNQGGKTKLSSNSSVSAYDQRIAAIVKWLEGHNGVRLSPAEIREHKSPRGSCPWRSAVDEAAKRLLCSVDRAAEKSSDLRELLVPIRGSGVRLSVLREALVILAEKPEEVAEAPQRATQIVGQDVLRTGVTT